MAGKQPRRPHWRVPTVIALSYIAGVAFAVGHHLFYQSLDAKPVDGHALSQQINTAIGTAFAFLVRSSLVIAVGTVYWQFFWKTLARKSLTILHVDSLAGALTSVFDLLDFRALRCCRLLGFLALLSWLLPLAAILPPATLSIHLGLTMDNVRARVPEPNFANDAMAVWWDQSDTLYGDPLDSHPGEGRSHYTKPSLQLSRLATLTAAGGLIPESVAEFANSTYILNFMAPAMKCQSISSKILQPFKMARAEACGDTSGQDSLLGDTPDWYCGEWCYIAWAPSESSRVPFRNITSYSLPLETPAQVGGDPYRKSPFYGAYRGDPAAFYIATKVQLASEPWSVLNCSLFNASYVVNMTSDTNRRNTASLVDVSILNAVGDGTNSQPRNYTTAPSDNDKAKMNYMALLDSTGHMFLGTITNTYPGHGRYYTDTSIIVQPPELMQTMLPYTKELLPFVAKVLSGSEDQAGNQWTVIEKGDDFTAAYPNFAFDAPSFNRSLGSVIEQLFHNITMAFLSEPAFAKDSEEEIPITIRRIHNVYSYDCANLLLSYGAALALSLLACILGGASIMQGNASYSNRVSTVIRTTRGSRIEKLIRQEDRSGQDPLPRYLGLALLRTRPEESEDPEVELVRRSEHASEIASEGSIIVPERCDDLNVQAQPTSQSWSTTSRSREPSLVDSTWEGHDFGRHGRSD